MLGQSTNALRRRSGPIVMIAGGLLAAAGFAWLQAGTQGRQIAKAPDAAALAAQAAANLDALPLAFEANRGQTDERVEFVTRAGGYVLFLTADRAVMSLPEGAVAMSFPGSSNATLEGVGKLPHRSNYLTGDPDTSITHVPNFSKVAYRDLYEGVDLEWHGAGRAAEYDFVVSAGVDPGVIRVKMDGIEGLRLDDGGNLRFRTPGGEVVQHAPFAYQGDKTEQVPAEFVVFGDNEFGFALGDYDVSRVLTIDPISTFSTFLGGTGRDEACAVSVDDDNEVVVTGTTSSLDFPLGPGLLLTAPGGDQDVFVTKLTSDGQSLVYSTYLAGSGHDKAYAIATGDTASFDDVAWITGQTVSPDYPTTFGAAQPTIGGGWDAFLTAIDEDGDTLLFSTFIGGSLDDYGRGVTLLEIGPPPGGDPHAMVSGYTASTIDFPMAGTPVQPAYGGGAHDAFLTGHDAETGALECSTYLGGTGDDRAYDCDSAGDDTYLCGYTTSTDFPVTGHGNPGPDAIQKNFGGFADAFVVQYNSDSEVCDRLVTATYFGGVGFDSANSISVADGGTRDVAICGQTDSFNFPVANPEQPLRRGPDDAFLTVFRPDMKAVRFSTYFGGSSSEDARSLRINTGAEYVVMGGWTDSPNLPVTGSAFHAFNAGGRDGFVARYSMSGDKEYATYYGGVGRDQIEGVFAPDNSVSVAIAGFTESVNFPQIFPFDGTYNGGTSDAFVGCIRSNGGGLLPLYAVELSQREVALTWEDVTDDETGFEVTRVSPDGYEVIANLPADTTSMTDSGLEPQTQYGYTVQAVSGDGDRTPSNFVVVTTLPNPPTAPALLRVEGVDGAQITFGWNDRSTDETSFDVRRSVLGGPFQTFGTAAAGATGLVVTDVPSSSQTSWQVVAVNLGGASQPTNSVTANAVATLDLRVRRGLLKNIAAPLRDKISVKGALGDGAAGFHPADQDVRIVIGASTHPFVYEIAAGDSRWKVGRRGKFTWKSGGRKVPGPRVKFTVNVRRGTFVVSVKNFDFETPLDERNTVGLILGGDGGALETTWATKSPETMVLR